MPSTSAGAAAVKKVLASLGEEKRRQHNAKVGPGGIAGAPPDRQFGCEAGDGRRGRQSTSLRAFGRLSDDCRPDPI